MALSFGSNTTPVATQQQPAPAASSGFNFGGGTPAPALGAGAPATSGAFNFATPVSAGVATPAAPTNGGFSFGNAPVAAAPATATSGAFNFAAAPTPAAPVGLGATPAPTVTTLTQQQQQQQQGTTNNVATIITPSTPYNELPMEVRTLIDGIVESAHRHRRTMASIDSMYPVLLDGGSSGSSSNGGGGQDATSSSSSSLISSNNTNQQPQLLIDRNATPLPLQIKAITTSLNNIHVNAKNMLSKANLSKNKVEDLYQKSLKYALWPMEALVVRWGMNSDGNGSGRVGGGNHNGWGKITSNNGNMMSSSNNNNLISSAANSVTALGVNINANNTNSTETRQKMERQLSEAVRRDASTVERLESIPSPYAWETLRDLEMATEDVAKNVLDAKRKVDTLLMVRNGSGGGGYNNGNGAVHDNVSGEEVGDAISGLASALLRVATQTGRVHEQTETLRNLHRRRIRQRKEQQQQQQLHYHHHRQNHQHQYNQHYHDTHEGGIDPFEIADRNEAEAEASLTEEARRVFLEVGAKMTPAPVSAVPTVGGGMFGATPAPVANGGLFGATQAVPATGGGLFGATPTSGLFGATPAAPAPAGGLFGAPPAGGLFGSAAAAPAFGTAPTPAFGAAPTAAAPTFGAAPAPAFGAAQQPGTTTFGIAAPTPAPDRSRKGRKGRRK